jgi:hypothetical protein
LVFRAERGVQDCTNTIKPNKEIKPVFKSGNSGPTKLAEIVCVPTNKICPMIDMGQQLSKPARGLFQKINKYLFLLIKITFFLKKEIYF